MPGLIIPGVLGFISLVLAGFAMQVLPFDTQLGQPALKEGVLFLGFQEATVTWIRDNHLVASMVEPGGDDSHLDALLFQLLK